MRSLQGGTRPDQDPVDIPAVESHGVQVHRFLHTVTPHRHSDIGLLHGALDLSETVHDLAVDRQNQIAREDERGCGRPCDQAIDLQYLPSQLVMLFEAPDPVVGQAQFPGVRQGFHVELGFERIELFAILHDFNHFGDQVGGNPPIDLLEFACGLEGEARPQRQYITLLIGQHAVEIARRVDQIDGLQVTVPEAQRTRQRERDDVDAGDLRFLRHDLRVAMLPDDPNVIPGGQLLGQQRCRPDGGIADGFRIVRNHREIMQWMDEFNLAGNFHGAIEGDAHIAHGERHRIAVDDHQAAGGIDDETRAVVILLRHAGYRVGHVERHRHERGRQFVDSYIAGLCELRGGRLQSGRLRTRGDTYTRPGSQDVVALALARREPASIHPDDLQLSGPWILQRHVEHRRPRAVGEAGKRCFEIRQRVDLLPVE